MSKIVSSTQMENLPTYEVLWMQKVWGIPNKKCSRCAIEEEAWEHIWICNKNDAGDTESELFKASLDEILNRRYSGQGPKESMERRFMGSSCYKIREPH
ncbi:hypothetical protein RhiirA4_477669 [Rhizophagus irregularis]|uniref:Uncharacterized protein n=1 Tax=Rhizophagus irregularis TaxID=588596 RepID=A0A2I1HDQ6_9GLOM|nr:hypothetical protein RhiirA4_477669 [Rhizophagus irregularis]